MADHECIIGFLHCRSNYHLITLDELKAHIAFEEEYNELRGVWRGKVFSLADYGDKRKSTDLTRFDFCPHCGTAIDWKAIRRGGY